MGLFNKANKNIWNEVKQTPNNIQVIFCLIITFYGYIHSIFSQMFLDVLEKTLKRGIRDKSGNLIQYQQINRETRDQLINNLALALMPGCYLPENNPVTYFDNYPLDSFLEKIKDLFKFDLNLKNKREISNSPDNIQYSKYSAEASSQLLVTWQKLIGSSDPEFNKLMNLSGFLEKWGECENSLFPGLIKGINRTEQTTIINRGKQECKNFSSDFYYCLHDLLESIKNQMSITSSIKNNEKYSSGVDSINQMDDGRFIITANKGSDFGGLLSATLQIILSDLNQSDKNSISYWAGLPQYQWTRKHQIAAEYSFKKYLLAKNRFGRIPPKIQPIIERIIEEGIDEDDIEIPSELISIFDRLMGF